MNVLGVDVGATGALAILTADGLNDGPAGRRAVNGLLLAELVAKAHASTAYIELVGARPGEVAGIKRNALAG